jgi:hypothetical protein
MVNFLDVQLGKFSYKWQASIQGIINKIQVKEQDNHNGEAGDTRMYSHSFFLLRGSTSTLERCGDTVSTNTTKPHHVLRWASWYVSNVSIIFDAPCLFYTNCFMFFYTSWHFYAFSWTNLLTRCHSASSLFSAIFVFQKIYIRNILRIGGNESQSSYLPDTKMESRGEMKTDQGVAAP